MSAPPNTIADPTLARIVVASFVHIEYNIPTASPNRNTPSEGRSQVIQLVILALPALLLGAPTTEPASEETPKPEEKQLEKPIPTPEKPSHVQPEPSVPADLGSGLTKVGPGKYELTRAEVYRLVAASPFVARQLWVRKVFKDGKLVGYKLKNIKAGSLPHKAGFRNGDVVSRIAGRRLTRPEELLLVVPTKDTIEVKLWRAAKLKTFTYTIVPD
jgi:hypothetical protein